MTIKTIVENVSGGTSFGADLTINSSELTVEEIISLRVRAEVSIHNRESKEGIFRGIVQPSGAEVMLNGTRVSRFRPVDADDQVKLALQAFAKQRLMILLPGGQAESLDQKVELSDGEEIRFLRLVPLVGG